MPFCIGSRSYCGVLDGFARCRLCGVDLKVSSRGLDTFLEHVRVKRHMLRDRVFRYARQMPLLTERVVNHTSVC